MVENEQKRREAESYFWRNKFEKSFCQGQDWKTVVQVIVDYLDADMVTGTGPGPLKYS